MERYLHNEIELLEKLRIGDPFAFEVLFYKYRHKVKGFVYKIVPTQIDPDEITQEVFVKVWLKRGNIDTTKNFQSYLFAIAKNLVMDYLKSAVNRKLYFVEEHFHQDIIMQEDEGVLIPEDAEERILDLIQLIPERRRNIFCLSRFEGLTYKEIAERLHISENTVDSQIRHSLDFLRKEFRKIITLFFLFFFK